MRKRSEVTGPKPVEAETREEIPMPKMEGHKGQAIGLHEEYERIVHRIYSVEPLREYEQLEASLTIGEERGDVETIRRHLDMAEDNARKAHRLYLGARLERKRWEVDAECVMAALRGKALYFLEQEKTSGERKKQITDADVVSRIAELYPDEYRHQVEKTEKVKGLEAHLERLADLWKARCYDLTVMLGTQRRSS